MENSIRSLNKKYPIRWDVKKFENLTEHEVNFHKHGVDVENITTLYKT